MSVLIRLPRFVCSAKDSESGRRMECYSNQPGVQFYPGDSYFYDYGGVPNCQGLFINVAKYYYCVFH